MNHALVLAIETIGEDWDRFGTSVQDAILSWVRRRARDIHEEEKMTLGVKHNLRFSPFTAYTVAIGLYDLRREAGVVYFEDGGRQTEYVEGKFIYKGRSEKEMLAAFWEGVKSYDTIVTYNGRSFTIPFILHRSAMNGIKPTKNLLPSRYPAQQTTVRHVDLLDEFTYFGAVSRKPNFQIACRAYGVEALTLTGEEIAELFANKKFRDLAEYNSRQVISTVGLYNHWQEYLNLDTDGSAVYL